MKIDNTYIEGLIDSNLPDNNERRNGAPVVRYILKLVTRWVSDAVNQVFQANSFKPFHRWTGSKLELQNPDGSWALPVDLRGWTPVFSTVQDGTRTVIRITDWTGGQEQKPPIGYLGDNGIVADIALARNIKGADGERGLGANATTSVFTAPVDPGMSTKYYPVFSLPKQTEGTFDFAKCNITFKKWDQSQATPQFVNLYAANRGGPYFKYTIEGANLPGCSVVAYLQANGVVMVYLRVSNAFNVASALVTEFVQATIFSSLLPTAAVPTGTIIFDTLDPAFPPMTTNTIAAGASGPAGAKGDKGDAGTAGAKGDKGDKGDAGTAGTAGAKGDKGDTGARGSLWGTGASNPSAGANGSPKDLYLNTTSFELFQMADSGNWTSIGILKGATGSAAYTRGLSTFANPAVGSTVTINVGDALWMAVGMIVYIFNVQTGSRAGYYKVISVNSATNVTLQLTDYVTPGSGANPGALITAAGERGPAGADGSGSGTGTQGAKGDKGDTGATGERGSKWYTNTVDPQSITPWSDLKKDDYYLKSTTGDYYRYSGTAWVLEGSLKGFKGDTGTAGSNGKTILNGSAAPANATGTDGDFFLNTANWTICGPKASGAWPGLGQSLIGPKGADGAGGSGNSSVGSFYETITPTTAAQLNTAIANCTKPVLYVIGSALTINEMIVINNKSNLRIIAHNMELTLNSWNSGTQGIMFDLQGNIKNVKIEGFRLNCPLPSSSGGGDGGGYGMIIARGAIVASIDGLTIENCHFTSPNLHMNAISLICVGWGGTSTIQNVLVRNCTAESVKRMFFECTNQQQEADGQYKTNGTIRYRNITVEGCYARNLGGNGAGTSGGMMVSFDGPGDNIEVKSNTVINPYFAAYEAVGINNVRFTNNVADYEEGYAANFVGYSFTDGQHGTQFGPTRVKVVGGRVRCTGRGFNLTNGGYNTFQDVAFESRQGNTIVNASNNEFRKCSIVGRATNEYLIALQQTAQNNVLTDCYLGNERSNDGSGGRCTLVLFDGACINNRFIYLNHYQEKRTNNNDWYEPSILDFSSNKASNEVLYNRTNNPSLSN